MTINRAVVSVLVLAVSLTSGLAAAPPEEGIPEAVEASGRLVSVPDFRNTDRPETSADCAELAILTPGGLRTYVETFNRRDHIRSKASRKKTTSSH